MTREGIAVIRDGAMVLAGVTAGFACALVLAGPLARDQPARGGPDAVAPPAAEGPQVPAPTAPSRTSASAPPAPGPAPGGTGAEPDAQPEGVVLYGPEGEFPCDEACVTRLTDAFLSGRASEEEHRHLYGAMDAMVRQVEADDAKRRRFLTLLGRLRIDPDGYPSPEQDFLMGVATHYDLDEALAREVADRLGRSPDAQARALALDVALMRDDTRALRRAVEGAFARETGGPALVRALQAVPVLRDGASPRLTAAVRDLAQGHADPTVRRAALDAYAWGGDRPEAERRAIFEQGLTDPAPQVRLGSVNAIASFASAPLPEAERERYRVMANEIASDEALDPELRMEALGLIAYGALSDEAERYRGHRDRY